MTSPHPPHHGKPIPIGVSPRALIRDAQGRILLLQRDDGARVWPGLWELPGGKPDANEHFAQSLVRETEEETGLAVTPLSLIGSAQTDITHSTGPMRVIFLVMHARVDAGQLTLSDEHQAARWVGVQELAGLAVIEALRPLIVEALVHPV
jgi:8-oxo-dGTP diphosphatase